MRSKADETLVIVETLICPLYFSFVFAVFLFFVFAVFVFVFAVLL